MYDSELSDPWWHDGMFVLPRSQPMTDPCRIQHPKVEPGGKRQIVSRPRMIPLRLQKAQQAGLFVDRDTFVFSPSAMDLSLRQ